MDIVILTDGSCLGNPGPGGFAAIIEVDKSRVTTVTGGDPQTTNSRMELSAAIEGLNVLNDIPDCEGTAATVRSDSKYLVDAFNANWIRTWIRNGWRKADKKPVKNRELWERLLAVIGNRRVRWQWVKGHSGDPGNEECDRLANAEAHHAPQVNGYWVSAGNPRSVSNPGVKVAVEPQAAQQDESEYERGRRDALRSVLPELNEISEAASDEYPADNRPRAYMYYYDGMLDDLSELHGKIEQRIAGTLR